MKLTLPFTRSFELSLTRNYVSRWGMAQAVRELIQNALDSTSPFQYEFARDDDREAYTLLLTSEFTTLTPQTLLLGSTSKSDQRDAIGSFGEGYKIALLVLTRLGYDVEMRNGDVLWRPRFRHNAKFGEELLVIDESPLTDKLNKGLTFAVANLTKSDVEEIRASCLQMQKDVGETKRTHLGDILIERPGKLYVGGLFVCNTELKFGYNAKPEHLKLERDRQTVGSWDLQCLTRDMWYATEEWDRIAGFIKDKVPDLEYAEYSSPEMVKEACYQLFKAEHPGAVAASSHAELKSLVAQGMTKTIVVNSVWHANVTSARSYRSQPVIRVQSPHERLSAWFEKAKYDMADKHKATFRDLLDQAKSWTIQ